MIIQSGTKVGKSTQELILKEPDWVEFFIAKNAQSKLAKEFARHSRTLTAKPFVEKCFGCKAKATRMTLYAGNVQSGMFWCD